MNTVRAAIYARVSTGDQNAALQVADLRQYCATRGWNICSEYIDTISGTKSSRPGRDKLMRDVRARRIDAVLVWKLDRWGRSLADSVITMQELASAGVRFICTTQGLDTDDSNPMGRAMLGMLQVFAQFERDMINERVNAGVKRYQIEHAAGRARSKSGKNLPMGRPKSIFRVDEAIGMRKEGLSWRKIAKQLGIPESTVRSRCAEKTSFLRISDSSSLGTKLFWCTQEPSDLASRAAFGPKAVNFRMDVGVEVIRKHIAV